MSVGFTVVHGAGAVTCRFLGCRPGEGGLVSVSQDQAGALVLLGRLHYRRALFADLAPHLPEGLAHDAATSDSALALAAYRHGGTDGLARLEGDFALALWDARGQRLVGMRDPLGGYPLFWTQGSGTFALGTSLHALRALRPGCDLDLDYLSEYLMLPSWSLPEPRDGRCVYQGIQRVLAGTIVSVNFPAGTVEQHRRWNWLERMVDPGTDRPEEMAARYGDLLRQAVRERLHGTSAAHLSGGMDSTSVCLLAADCLAAGEVAGPLHTLSLVYERLSGLAPETPYLDLVPRRAGVVAHRVPADDLLDFDAFDDAPAHDEPCPWLWRITMERALIDEAAGTGAATILTGLGADEMMDIQPHHLSELLRRGRLWTAWQEAARWARAENSSRWQFLYPFGIANLLPAWLRAGLGPLVRRGYGRWETLNEWAIAPWIRRDFARRHDLRGRGLENVRRMHQACRPVGLSLALYGIADSANDFSRWYLAAPRGIVLTHPFLDPRVLCLGLGIQTRYTPEPGRRKPLLAEAMRGLLPEAIRTRRSKGHFDEVYYLGLARNLPALEALVRQAPVADLGLFDQDVLLDCLHRAALGAANGLHGLIRLNSTLTFLKWLTLQEQGQAAAEAPAHVAHWPAPGAPRGAEGSLRASRPARGVIV
jgi:asparagine synthase (glutamine-hydrolysing)